MDLDLSLEMTPLTLEVLESARLDSSSSSCCFFMPAALKQAAEHCGVSAKRQAELAAAEAGKAAAEAVRCAPTEPLPPTVETKLGQAKSAQEKLGDLVKRLKGEADPARQKDWPRPGHRELELQEVLKAKERAETLLKALKVEKGLLEEQLGTARTEARMAKEEAIQAKERAAEASLGLDWWNQMATARKAEVQMQTIKTKAEEEVKAAKMPGYLDVEAEEAKLKAERSVEELKQKALSDKDATAQGLQKKLDDALRAKAAAEASEERSKKKDLELKSLREDLEQLRNQLKDRDKQLRAVTEQVATINNSWAQHVEALHEKYQAT
eukprot:g14814.t1